MSQAGSHVTVPKLGLTMTEATLTQWIAGEGDKLAADSLVATIETDKVAYEICAPSDGRLGRILVKAGETVPVGAAIAEWLPETPLAAVDSVRQTSPQAGEPQDEDQPAPPIATPAPVAERIVATPLARRLARQLDVDLNAVAGSGPRSRIKAADVQTAHLQRQGVQPRRAHDLTEPGPVVRTMAKRMVQSKREIPHFYMSTTAEISDLELLRARLNEESDSAKVSLTHLIVAAVAHCLAVDGKLGRVWTEDGILNMTTVDIGLAVDTDRGLYNPMIRRLETRSFRDIVRITNDVIERARSGKLVAADHGGGSLTLSNAGMYGVQAVAPIIVPGQSAILGVGAATEIFRPDGHGKPELQREIGLVLSADHRVHTGVEAAGFLGLLKRAIENPISFIAGSGRRG